MAAKRGRTSNFVMPDSHRVKIANANILNCLIEHVKGERSMSMTQVTAGLALLKKVLPDLSSVEITGKDGGALEINDVTARETLQEKLMSLAARQAVDTTADRKLN